MRKNLDSDDSVQIILLLWTYLKCIATVTMDISYLTVESFDAQYDVECNQDFKIYSGSRYKITFLVYM